MSHLGGKFEFTPFKVALRETIQWLLEHYDTDARIGRRGHSDKGAYKGAANGHKNGTPVHVERGEPIEAE